MKREPLRVAQVLRQMNLGGIEAVVMNYYRMLDRDRVQFDFLVEEGSQIPFREEIEALGARVYTLPPLKRLPAYTRALRKRLRENRYPIVHVNMNTLGVFPLWAAEKEGIAVRINHNHSTSHPSEGKRALLKHALRPFAGRYATERFACGELAGTWMFGEDAVQSGMVHVLHNAIDLDRFAFSKTQRMELRGALGLGDAPVIGHVGRFCVAKNHAFAVESFAALRKRRPDARMIMAGEGETMGAVREKAAALHAEDAILFLGARTDVAELYAAMDVFILPSVFEGLPVTGVEAQAEGLPCIFSEHVARETAINPNVRFLPLDSPEQWADAMLEGLQQANERNIDRQRFVQAGFDIHTEAKRLERLYLELAGADSRRGRGEGHAQGE